MEFIPEIKDTRVYKSKVRDSSLDAICGLFIIYMIITHAFQWSNVTDDEFYVNSQYIFFMFMAWFFYKSGMFHKRERFREVAFHNWKRLIVPCIVYSAVGEVVYWVNLYHNGLLNIHEIMITPVKELIINGSLSGNLPLWFLITLFLVKLIVSIVDNYNIHYSIVLSLSLVVAWGGHFVSERISHIPLTLLNTALGLIFYIIGKYMRKLQYDKRTLAVSFIVFVAVSYLKPSIIGFRSDVVLEGNWMIGVVNCVAGIVIFNNLFKLRMLQLPLLTNVGKYSMDYYCAHWILFNVIVLIYSLRDQDIPNYYELYVLLAWSAIVLPCFSYWYEYIHANGLKIQYSKDKK